MYTLSKRPRWFLFASLLLLLSSCQKDFEPELFEPGPIDSVLEGTTLFPGILGLRNGVIQFADLDAYLSSVALAAEYSDETNLQWAQNLGFESVAAQRLELVEQYESIVTEEQLQSFRHLLAADPYFDYDDGYFTSELMGAINWLVDQRQMFYVGEKLYQKKSDYLIIIESGDPDLLQAAEQHLTSDVDQGIHVIYTPTKIDGIGFRGPYCDNEHEVKGKFGEKRKKRMRYEWKVDYMGEPIFTNGHKTIRNVYIFDATMRTHKKKGFIWMRTWIDARIQLQGEGLGNTQFYGDCAPFYDLYWPPNINISASRAGVAEWHFVRVIRDNYADNYCVLIPQYFIQYGNYRSLCERTDDDRNINQDGLHVVIDCDR